MLLTETGFSLLNINFHLTEITNTTYKLCCLQLCSYKNIDLKFIE